MWWHSSLKHTVPQFWPVIVTSLKTNEGVSSLSPPSSIWASQRTIPCSFKSFLKTVVIRSRVEPKNEDFQVVVMEFLSIVKNDLEFYMNISSNRCGKIVLFKKKKLLKKKIKSLILVCTTRVECCMSHPWNIRIQASRLQCLSI